MQAHGPLSSLHCHCHCMQAHAPSPLSTATAIACRYGDVGMTTWEAQLFASFHIIISVSWLAAVRWSRLITLMTIYDTNRLDDCMLMTCPHRMPMTSPSLHADDLPSLHADDLPYADDLPLIAC